MHHLPAGPSPATRLLGTLTRSAARLGHGLAVRPRRAVPLLLLGVVLAVLGVAAPTMSGAVAGHAPVSLDSSSTASAGASGDSDIRMGVDGAEEPTGAPSPTGRQFAADRPSAATPQSTVGRPSPVAGTTSASATGRTASSAPVTAPPLPRVTTPSVAAAPARPAAGPAAAASPATTGSSAAGSATAAGSPPASSSAAAPSARTPSPSAPVLDGVAGAGDAVLGLIDHARAGHGCAALTEDPALTTLAQEHSTRMATDGVLELTGLAGRTATVAQGEPTAASVVAAWLGDASDAAALLDCDRTRVGVGEATGTGGPWWTAVLG